MLLTVAEVLNDQTINLEEQFIRFNCQKRSLARRGKDLMKKLKQIADIIDTEKYFVKFENIIPFPGYGKSYDAFVLLDKETKTSVFRVIPKTEYIPAKGKAMIYNFPEKGHLGKQAFEGTWQEAKAFLKEVA